MSTIDEIKSAIYHSSHKDLELFRAWFYEYEGKGRCSGRETKRPCRTGHKRFRRRQIHFTGKHIASPQFWLAYRKLPASIRRLARKNFKLLKSDMRHPSLHLKRVVRHADQTPPTRMTTTAIRANLQYIFTIH